MDREDYLRWCRNCKIRNFDINKGVVCSLTKEIACFQNECRDFEFDKKEFKKNVANDVCQMFLTDHDYSLKPKKIKWAKYSSSRHCFRFG